MKSCCRAEGRRYMIYIYTIAPRQLRDGVFPRYNCCITPPRRARTEGPPARPAATGPRSGTSRSFATVMRTAGRSIRRRRSTAVRAAHVGSPVRDDTRKRTRRLSREGRAHHCAPSTFSPHAFSAAAAATFAHCNIIVTPPPVERERFRF